jgi:putative ABC transport system substrate-binding protein
VPAQPVDATQALNLSAGVSNCKTSQKRSPKSATLTGHVHCTEIGAIRARKCRATVPGRAIVLVCLATLTWGCMRRRDFIRAISGAVAAWPIAARAQQPTMPVIGFLSPRSANESAPQIAAFRGGLKEVGYVEGRNVAIEFRWAEGHNDRLEALADDLVHHQVTVIAVPGSTPGALAVKAATKTIPIVFALGSNPVELGLVASLNRPGANITGVTVLGVEIAPKQLELLHELVPTVTIIALLINPTSPTLAEIQSRDLQAAANRLGLQLHVLRASTERDFDTVFATLARLRVGGLVISSDAFFTSRVQKLADLSTSHSIPAIYWQREYVMAGGLASYGGSYLDAYRLAGAYTRRILNGEKPSELPVQQSTKLELAINLKTANALRIDVPAKLLALADVVIE